jgi:CheY-like chemotaxis protein
LAELPASQKETTVEARAGLLADVPTICAELGDLYAALSRDHSAGPEQQEHLQDLFFKVRFLTETAALAGLAVLEQATAVFDGLLSALMECPGRLNPSALRTVESLVEVVGLLLQQVRESGDGKQLSARVLILNDDPAANEQVTAGLCRAWLDACGTEDSIAAWQWINSEQFDLVLLKMDMPVLNGLQLGERMRKVPGYRKTPLIFIAGQDNLDKQAGCTLVGATDLITNPILPQELAARVVVHLVRTRMRKSKRTAPTSGSKPKPHRKRRQKTPAPSTAVL